MEKLKINNIDVYYEYDTRYKNINYRMYLYTPFKKELVVPFKILCDILSKVNEYYPTEESSNYYLEDLYNTSSSISYGVIGKIFRISCGVNVLNPKYLGLSNYDLVKDAIKFNIDCLLHPYLSVEDLELEKRLAVNRIDRLKSRKDSYAYYKYNQIIYNGEIQSITGLEDKEFIKNYTIEQLKQAYEVLIKSKSYVIISGDISKDEVINVLSKQELSKFIPYCMDKNMQFIDYDESINKSIKEVSETLDTDQTILHIGYRSDIRKSMPRRLRTSANVMAQMLGAFFHSDLFRVIREERNLAYDVQTSLDAKFTLTISAYISIENIEVVKNIIFDYIDKYKNGNISEEVLNLTIESIVSQVKKDSDSVLNPFLDLFDQLHGFDPISDEEYIKFIKTITVSDIKEAANHFYLDTIYSLCEVEK